jgi:hypothetical protein
MTLTCRNNKAQMYMYLYNPHTLASATINCEYLIANGIIQPYFNSMLTGATLQHYLSCVRQHLCNYPLPQNMFEELKGVLEGEYDWVVTVDACKQSMTQPDDLIDALNHLDDLTDELLSDLDTDIYIEVKRYIEAWTDAASNYRLCVDAANKLDAAIVTGCVAHFREHQ